MRIRHPVKKWHIIQSLKPKDMVKNRFKIKNSNWLKYKKFWFKGYKKF
jgi:hypothetical protein